MKSKASQYKLYEAPPLPEKKDLHHNNMIPDEFQQENIDCSKVIKSSNPKILALKEYKEELLKADLEFEIPKKVLAKREFIKRVPSTNFIREQPKLVEKFAEDCVVICQLEKNHLIIKGEDENINNFLSAIYRVETSEFQEPKDKIIPSQYSLIEIKLSQNGVKDLEELEIHCAEQDVILENLESRIIMGGYIDKLSKMMTTLYENELKYLS